MNRARLRSAVAGWLDPRRQQPEEADRATEADVIACYRLLLGRTPDAGGLQAYLPYVHVHHISVDELVKRFVSSTEFRQRLTTRLDWSAGAPIPVDLLRGYRIYVRDDDFSVGNSIRQAREYEPHVTRHLEARLRPGMVFVDVGASLGFYTVLAGRAVGPTGRVVACEPGPQNHSVLRLNVAVNDLTERTEIHPVAIADRPGWLLYSQAGANGAVASYTGDPNALATQDLVPAVTLDVLLQDSPRVDVIKIDVEGAEGMVLRGATATLERHHPHLYFEFTISTLEALSEVTAAELLGTLEKAGYRFVVLDAAEPSVPTDAIGLIAAFEAHGEGHLDVYAGQI